MNPTFKEMTGLFVAEGIEDLPQTRKTYLFHAIGVYTDMKAWGGDEELCRVYLCDYMEQVARDGLWQGRREAFRSAAERLGGAALEAYDRVFADEPDAEMAG